MLAALHHYGTSKLTIPADARRLLRAQHQPIQRNPLANAHTLQRGFTLPAAATASAKAARSAFFCELCQKGYSRMNEYEAHQSSYDHTHKQSSRT